MEGGEKRHQPYPQEVPPDVRAKGAAAIEEWRAHNAAEWARRELKNARNYNAFVRYLMAQTNDARMLLCSMLPPLDMYMLYETTNLEEASRDESAALFRTWCNRTTNDSLEEQPNIWDVLFEKYYAWAGPRDRNMGGDQRRWTLYAYVLQRMVLAMPLGEFKLYLPGRSGQLSISPVLDRVRDRFSIGYGWDLPGAAIAYAMGARGFKITPAVKVKISKEQYHYVLYGESPQEIVIAMTIYEAFQRGWVYRMIVKREEEVTIHEPIACSTCSSPTVRYVCRVCAGYAFCSHECSDAVAEEHSATCGSEELSAEAELVGASLNTWKSYGALELVQKVEAFLRKFGTGHRWILKQLHRREIQHVIAAIDARLAQKQNPQTTQSLEVLRQRVAAL